MKKLSLVLVALALLLALLPAGMAQAEKPAPSLTSTIDYWFVGHLGITDPEERLLVWEGTISGDIEGVMLWWFVLGGGPPNMPDAAHVSFYEARGEIWDDNPLINPGANLLLAVESSGVTAKPPGKDGIWNGHGIVTEAYGAFTGWDGRQVYETGNVNWDFPYSGTGIYRIN